ncbi:ras guanine nucleotide exchange factor domain-containing protein [Cunninghamella echinulata]|nr:ras guanine nucleotide exchange factor domain-containing protein [Cunninghamella echinulata]
MNNNNNNKNNHNYIVQSGTIQPSSSTNNNNTINELRLLNSKSTPTFDQIKRSTSQSLRNMGVASLKNISRKPRRFSNQNHKKDSNVSPMTQSPTMENSLNDVPLRTRLSTSFRLRRHTDADLHKKIIEEQKLMKEEKENRPWFVKKQCNESESMYNSYGVLIGASLQVLVDTLTCHENPPDTLFLRTFFYNFRLFTEPKILAKKLIDRFNLKPPTHPETKEPLSAEEEKIWEDDVHVPIQLRVFFMLKNWFESYYDGSQDKEAAQLLLAFSKTDMEIGMRSHAKRMTELIELKLMTTTTGTETVKRKNSTCSIDLSHENITITTSGILPIPSPTSSTPIRNVLRRALSNHNNYQQSINSYHHHLQDLHINNSTQSSTISIYRMDPQEIANQLTLLESALFYKVPPNELMVTHKKKNSPAMHVKAMVQQSTLMAYWITNTILGEIDTKIRVMVIKFWIKVADACLQLNNFNTLMTIRCALNSAGIARLKKTWDSVMRSTKYKSMYNTINNVADSDRNFAVYRKCLKNAVAPGIPFLGIFLSDVIFIDEGNLDHRSNCNSSSTTTMATASTAKDNNKMLINFDKYKRMTQMLDQTIIRFQQVPYYKLKEIKEIQHYLVDCIEAGNESNEELIYSKSLEIEPRIVEEVCV